MVLVDHWLGEMNRLPLGALGVTIFFVLSGFLITRILLSSKDKLAGETNGLGRYLKTFYIRRTLRIFPLYYSCLLILLIADVPPVRETIGWFLLYASNLYIGLNAHWMGVVDHLWSLAVEEQVYLFFPFLLFFVPKRYVPLTMWTMIAGSIAFRYILFVGGSSWIKSYVLTPSCLDSFGLGALLAYVWLYRRTWVNLLFSHSAGVVVSLLAYVLVIAASKAFENPHNILTEVWERLAGSVLGFFLIGRAAYGFKGWMKALLENSICRYLGQISYGMYIFHNLIYNPYHTPATHPTLQIWNKMVGIAPVLDELFVLKFFYFAALTILAASISWFCLEKPINSMKERFSY